jgi:hypothetical protein
MIKFSHKSIMEYFAARAYYDEIKNYKADLGIPLNSALNYKLIATNE